MQMELKPKSIIVCGSVTYSKVLEGHSEGKLSIFDHTHIALLFPVNKKVAKALRKREEERDTHDRALLVDNLMLPLRDQVEAPMLRIIAESFKEPEVVDTWMVTTGYVDVDGLPHRAYMLSPPKEKRPIREPYEYVAPLLTSTRETGPTLRINFDAGHEDDEDV